MKITICWTHGICGIHMELYNLINPINMMEINHLDIIACEYNVTFDDVALLK